MDASKIIDSAFARSLRSCNPDFALDHSQAFRQVGFTFPPNTVRPVATQRKAEAGLSAMLQGLALYAEAHEKAYHSPIGNDGVLGDEWIQIARGIVGLLNGESGRLDCGAMDSAVRDLAVAAGFTSDLDDRK